MKDLFFTFFIFFKKCSKKEKLFFYLGALSSALAGFSEALLFKYLGDFINDLTIVNISLSAVIFVIFIRFLWIFASAYLISKSSSMVTQSVMEFFISSNFSPKNENENNIPQVINESERIGMGYYLAWQNILSNFLQFLALFMAAAILTSREFILVMVIILPMYLIFSNITSLMVSKIGFIRMNTLRKLSLRLSKKTFVDNKEKNTFVNPLISSILKVRIWSLIQKPSLELMGILSLGVSIFIDINFYNLTKSEVLPAYALLATIFIRLLPYVNQIQNGFTLASSVQHEVISFNEENI